MTTNFYQERFVAHLQDTSAYGNVYYFSYHKWVAITKENFFISKVAGFSDLFKKQGMKLFVLQSSLKLFGEAGLHDMIIIQLTCSLLKKIKAQLTFKCFNVEGKELAISENIIVFVNNRNELIPIPDNIRKALLSISGEKL